MKFVLQSAVTKPYNCGRHVQREKHVMAEQPAKGTRPDEELTYTRFLSSRTLVSSFILGEAGKVSTAAGAAHKWHSAVVECLYISPPLSSCQSSWRNRLHAQPGEQVPQHLSHIAQL
ncbi:uncharacterized [Tachysurus ichikawai]